MQYPFFRRESYAYYSTARQGCTVVVPFREEMTKRHLKVTGDLGRIVFVVRGEPSVPAQGSFAPY